MRGVPPPGWFYERACTRLKIKQLTAEHLHKSGQRVCKMTETLWLYFSRVSKRAELIVNKLVGDAMLGAMADFWLKAKELAFALGQKSAGRERIAAKTGSRGISGISRGYRKERGTAALDRGRLRGLRTTELEVRTCTIISCWSMRADSQTHVLPSGLSFYSDHDSPCLGRRQVPGGRSDHGIEFSCIL